MHQTIKQIEKENLYTAIAFVYINAIGTSLVKTDTTMAEIIAKLNAMNILNKTRSTSFSPAPHSAHLFDLYNRKAAVYFSAASPSSSIC